MEWPNYGGDSANSKYSPLDQIHRDNANRLHIAWRWSSPDNEVWKDKPALRPFVFEATPLMVDGTLYTSTSLSQVAAIDAATGVTRWLYDPRSYQSDHAGNVGFVNRGVAYWSNGEEQRIFLGTGDGHLIALDARSGKPYPQFGKNGRIDLTLGLRRPIERRHYSVTSPPIVCHDVLIVGSSIPDLIRRKETPPGDVRGFDVRTGELLWTFHSVPQAGEYGNETWKEGSWEYAGNTNVWSVMSADQELGYIYLPFSAPASDYYGGPRPGDNLFANSLVCLNAKTGERVWHFQTVHHDLWDYDLAAAPNLVNITVSGKEVRAVAQVTKHGFCFVFDRITGRPIWPIEERPVPQSRLEGEETSPTQPFPTRPPPFERQGLSAADLIDFVPELRQEALDIIEHYEYGPMFTPPALKPTVYLPGNAGGANWMGAAFDPLTGTLYVPSISSPYLIELEKPDTADSELTYQLKEETQLLLSGSAGLPLVKPPYSRVTAIDLNRGTHLWMIPFGEGPRQHPLLKHLELPKLGSGARAFLLLTRTLLFAGEGANNERLLAGIRGERYSDCCNNQPKFRAFDKATGELIWEMEIPGHASGSPMTYSVNGKQYIVVAIGGLEEPAELLALALD